VKVTNLDAGNLEDRPHPTGKLAQAKTAVNDSVLQGTETHIEVSVTSGDITDQMRNSYERFWQLLIGRQLDNGPDP